MATSGDIVPQRHRDLVQLELDGGGTMNSWGRANDAAERTERIRRVETVHGRVSRDLLDRMMSKELDGYTYYAHNFARYDGILLLGPWTDYARVTDIQITPLVHNNALYSLDITRD